MPTTTSKPNTAQQKDRQKPATKGDVYDSQVLLRSEIKATEDKLRSEIQEVRAELKAEIQEVKNEIARSENRMILALKENFEAFYQVFDKKIAQINSAKTRDQLGDLIIANERNEQELLIAGHQISRNSDNILQNERRINKLESRFSS